MDDMATYTADTAKLRHLKHRLWQAECLAKELHSEALKKAWGEKVTAILEPLEKQIEHRTAVMD